MPNEKTYISVLRLYLLNTTVTRISQPNHKIINFIEHRINVTFSKTHSHILAESPHSHPLLQSLSLSETISPLNSLSLFSLPLLLCRSSCVLSLPRKKLSRLSPKRALHVCVCADARLFYNRRSSRFPSFPLLFRIRVIAP